MPIMPALKNAARSLGYLLLAQCVCLAATHAQDAPKPSFSEQQQKQEQIYQESSEEHLKSYVVDRALSNYRHALPPEFDRTLEKLGPDDRWLDIGAGMGLAILDYYSPLYDSTHTERAKRHAKKARAVAMSIEDRRSPYWYEMAARLEPNQIQYMHNKRLLEYSLQDLGQFDIITDVIGGFSYTSNLSAFVEKTLGFLELNGNFFTVLQDVRSEAGTNKPYYEGAPYLTQIKDGAGADVGVCPWLKSISCVRVTCGLKSDWKPPIEVYRVEKVCDNVVVPPLERTHYEAGTPPERVFKLASPLPAAQVGAR
jgi:hypothetical protein